MDKILFVGLNIADAWLTKATLSLGAIELNPITAGWGTPKLCVFWHCSVEFGS